MAPPGSNFVYCVGNPALTPDQVIQDTDRLSQARDLLTKDDLLGASKLLLGLPDKDTYTYHAMTSVSLAQVQHAVSLGGVNGLHTWYRQEDGAPVRRHVPVTAHSSRIRPSILNQT